MPLRPPALDDRSFDDLVEEVLARIPAHTPEWTNPRPGDPGRTLLELFAWLADALLYRANLIPERQRLAFLRLLGVPLRPAVPARGLVSIALGDDKVASAVPIQPLATIKGPAAFETRGELTVLPVTAEAYYKRPLTSSEQQALAPVIQGLQQIYGLSSAPTPYVTTPVFAGGAAEPDGFDLVGATDKCLWLALLAAKPDLVEPARQALGTGAAGGQQLINVGVMPAISVPALFEEIGPRARIPHVWEISTGQELGGQPEYLPLDPIGDSTQGLTQPGVLRLALPAAEKIGAPSNDVRVALQAGVGDRPPRLDVPEKSARLVAWVRLRPTVALSRLALSWVGINAVEIDQRQTVVGRVVGQSDGTAGQELQLPGQSIEPESLLLQVEEAGQGYVLWRQVDDLALAGRDDAVYRLDPEAGTVQFGDGVRGRIPEVGRRVRVLQMRAGGGRAGNLPAGSLTDVSARGPDGASVTTKLKVLQSLPTTGGEDAETLAQAEQRIPALFRHRDRAVTEDDYRRLAIDTPGMDIGRVEVLPRFKPQQRRLDVPGVVSVMVLPSKAGTAGPNPRADRPFLEAVHAYLDARRPLATELYTIGCEYVPLGVSVGVTVQDGFSSLGAATRGTINGVPAAPGAAPTAANGLAAGSLDGPISSATGLLGTLGPGGFQRDGVLRAVREALRLLLWPLPPGGPAAAGWPLGRAVRDRELEVAVARVAGVQSVVGIKLFLWQKDAQDPQQGRWARLSAATPSAPVEIPLQPWQLPELLSVVVTEGDALDDLRGAPNPFATAGVGVPVVPEVC